MQNGPYLLFTRFGDGIDPEQDAIEWEFLRKRRGAQAGYGLVASPDSIVTYHAWQDEIAAFTVIPDAVEFIEVASVSSVFARSPFSPDPIDDDGEEVDGMIRLTALQQGDARVEKACAQHRLALIWLPSLTEARDSDRLVTQVCRVLGGGARVVWPAKSFAGIYFSSKEECQRLAARLAAAVPEDEIYDFGIFSLAGSSSPEPISPLSIMLTGNR